MIETVKNQELTGVVVVDGKNFVNCVFVNATLVHFGANWGIDGGRFTNVGFSFADNANHTLRFLRMIRATDNGEQILRELVEQAAPAKLN